MVPKTQLSSGDVLFIFGSGLAQIACGIVAQSTEVVVVFNQVFSTVRSFCSFGPTTIFFNVVGRVGAFSLEGVFGELDLPLHSDFLGRRCGRPHIVGIVSRLSLEGGILFVAHLPDELGPEVLVLAIEPLVGVGVAGLPLEPTLRQHKILGGPGVDLLPGRTLGHVVVLVLRDEVLGVVVLGLVGLLFSLGHMRVTGWRGSTQSGFV